MNWTTFKTELEKHKDLPLQFCYADGKTVNAAYHITEIKQTPITSVDCGGVVNKWTEIIVQLWEPAGGSQDVPMSAQKALSIVAVVEKALPLVGDATVKIEFGNPDFDTRQMLPREISVINNQLIVNLQADAVQCKAQDRGGSCGPAAEDDCCAPAKPKLQLINLTPAAACCTPGGGCC